MAEMSGEVDMQLVRREHRQLDKRIAKLQRNRCVDPLELAELKRRKLQLKDTIARLERLMTAH